MKRISFALAVSLFISVCSYAQSSTSRGVSRDLPVSRETLRGISSLTVFIPEVPKDIQRDGLKSEQFKNFVASRLRAAGITFNIVPEVNDTDAHLIVFIDIIKHPQGVYIFAANVAVLQPVQLERVRVPNRFPAETYSKVALGLTTPNRIDVIQQAIGEKLDEFITDYRAVNQKP